jgi:hypothetical protein
MEIPTSAEKLAQSWKLKVKDWDLNAALVSGTDLADGIKVSKINEHGFVSHKTSFGTLGQEKFRMAIGDVEAAHKDSNFLTVFPNNDTEIIMYRFKNFMPATDADKRSGFMWASAYFVVDKGEGSKFIDQVKQEPTLADALLMAQFPVFKSDVKTRDWDNLLYLPQDLFFRTAEQQIQVIAKR